MGEKGDADRGTAKFSEITPRANIRKGDGTQDVYAVGLQEVVDLNAVNIAINKRSQDRKTH